MRTTVFFHDSRLQFSIYHVDGHYGRNKLLLGSYVISIANTAPRDSCSFPSMIGGIIKVIAEPNYSYIPIEYVHKK